MHFVIMIVAFVIYYGLDNQLLNDNTLVICTIHMNNHCNDYYISIMCYSIKDNHFVTTRVSPFTGNKYQDRNIDPISTSITQGSCNGRIHVRMLGVRGKYWITNHEEPFLIK